jgi:hypothetical protein
MSTVFGKNRPKEGLPADTLVAKYDAAGNVVWQDIYGADIRNIYGNPIYVEMPTAMRFGLRDEWYVVGQRYLFGRTGPITHDYPNLFILKYIR